MTPAKLTTQLVQPGLVRTSFASPLGDMVLAASQNGLTSIWFTGQKHAPDWSSWHYQTEGTHALLDQAVLQLGEYFAGRRTRFVLPLDLNRGTLFQQQVWQALLPIPFGNTVSYGGLSRSMAKPNATRAVAAAIGRNPLSIVVPCHRVVGSNGALTGYAGGLDRKRSLLLHEGKLQS